MNTCEYSCPCFHNILYSNTTCVKNLRTGTCTLISEDPYADSHRQAHKPQRKYCPAWIFEVTHTPGLWQHITRPIYFSLVLYDFGVKYVEKADAAILSLHLKITMESPNNGQEVYIEKKTKREILQRTNKNICRKIHARIHQKTITKIPR